jgi:hypothetical protein
MSHNLTDEQLATYLQNMATAKELLDITNNKLIEAEKKLVEFAEIMKRGTEDIQVFSPSSKARVFNHPKFNRSLLTDIW